MKNVTPGGPRSPCSSHPTHLQAERSAGCPRPQVPTHSLIYPLTVGTEGPGSEEKEEKDRVGRQ